MTGFEIYILVVCLIVYIMLAGVFSYMIARIFKLTLRVIIAGLEDKRIKDEYIERKMKQKERVKGIKFVDVIVSFVVCMVMISIFSFSLYVNIAEDTYFNSVPTMRVVKSASMSKKHEKNSYLVANELDNQFDRFDLIFVYKAPDEFELELYDVVVYDIEGEKIIHIIVGIEEPNDRHPGERRFTLQGDANEYSDRYLVSYSQIEAIYKSNKIPFIGSFIFFMQSPAGYMCIILVVIAMIASYLIEQKIYEEERIRLEAMGLILPLYDYVHYKNYRVDRKK